MRIWEWWYGKYSYDWFKGKVGLNFIFDVIFVCLVLGVLENVIVVFEMFLSIDVSWKFVFKVK